LEHRLANSGAKAVVTDAAGAGKLARQEPEKLMIKSFLFAAFAACVTLDPSGLSVQQTAKSSALEAFKFLHRPDVEVLLP
jgi:hypothetical protein